MVIPDYNGLVSALIESGRLSETDALDERRVDEELVAIWIDFVDRWPPDRENKNNCRHSVTDSRTGRDLVAR